MRALVFRGDDGMVVERIPEPDVGPGDVLVEIVAAGICGSDVHGFAGETGRRIPGTVMGHEITGVIVAKGREAAGWKRGDRVVVNPVIGCRECLFCRSGQTNRCPDRRVIGVSPDLLGAFTERIAVPADNVVRLAGTRCQDVDGSLVEPLAVGLNAVRQAGVLPGESVAVFGLGMIGLACVWAARREGADVVYAGDVDASRVELACSLAPGGAVVGFDAGGEALHDRLVRQGVPLPDRCVDAVGLAATCRDALRAVRVGGVVSIVGMAAPVVELDMYEVTTNEKTLVGSFCYSAATFEECAEAVAAGEVDAALFVDSVIGLDDAPQTFAELAAHTRSSVKTIVLPHR